jgi:hypothetical protein
VVASLLAGACSTAPKPPADSGSGGSMTNAGGAPGTSSGSGGAPDTTSTSSGSSSSSTSTSSGSSSSSTSTSSSSSSSSTTSTSSSGSTTLPPGCNGACGQAGCEAFDCADAPPMGWDGPFQLFNGPSGQAPSCPATAGNQVLAAYLDPHGDPATCSTCTVGAPYGETCYTGVTTFSDSACSADPSMILATLGFCNPVNGEDLVGFAGTAPPQAEYYCDVPEQNPTVPPFTWNTAAVGCAAPSAPQNGCGANRLCVPSPAAPFQPHLCISKAADAPCPGSTYTARTVFYTTALDSRTCTPCGYNRADITCTATTVLFSDSSCGNTLTAVNDFSGACMALPGTLGSTKIIDASFSGTPSCSPVGGAPTGAVAPSGPVTVCCTP